MKTTFFKNKFFYIFLFYIIGFFIGVLISVIYKDFSHLYGYILFSLFSNFYFVIDVFWSKFNNKKLFFIKGIIKQIIIFIPCMIVMILYWNKIYKINALGLLNGSIIFLINFFIYYFFEIFKKK